LTSSSVKAPRRVRPERMLERRSLSVPNTKNLVKQQFSARWRNALSGVDLLHQAQGGGS
jgi:hypothetical protein